MRYLILTDNLTDGPKDSLLDLDDIADADRARSLVEAGVIEPAGGAPAKSAAKPDWVAWAVLSGADPAEAEALTKPELVTKYGEDA